MTDHSVIISTLNASPLKNGKDRKCNASVELENKNKLSVEEVQCTHFPCCQPFRHPRARSNEVTDRLLSCRHGAVVLVLSPAQLFKSNRYDSLVL